MYNQKTRDNGGEIMTAKQRVLALKYLEKQKKKPNFAKKIGVEIKIKEKEDKNEQICNYRFRNV